MTATTATPATSKKTGVDYPLSDLKLDAKIPAGPLADKWTKHKFESKLVLPANKRKYTVLVVGSGLAGASAAASQLTPCCCCRCCCCCWRCPR